MTEDRTEQLVRDAFAEEAARAADPREVLAGVRGRRPRRSYGLVLATAAVVVVVAAVAAFVVPKVFQQSSLPAAGERHTQPAANPQNVLVVGIDGERYTDSIVLAQLAADGTTSVVSLPRDTWLPQAGTKLSLVYRNSGVDALATMVTDLTGVRVDHWVVLDTAAVGALTNALGGVEVCLRAAASDRYSGAEFPAGKQVISGDAVVSFLRQRHGLPNGDLDRIARLQAVLRSVLAKLDGKHIPTLLDAVKGHVQLDPGLDVLGFLSGANGTVHFGTIPITEVDYQPPQGGGSAIAVDPNQVKQFVTDLPNTQGDSVHTGTPCVN